VLARGAVFGGARRGRWGGRRSEFCVPERVSWEHEVLHFGEEEKKNTESEGNGEGKKKDDGVWKEPLEGYGFELLEKRVELTEKGRKKKE